MHFSLNTAHAVFVVLSLLLPSVSASSWSYSGVDGPANWTYYAATCGGSKQSPINIVTSDTTPDVNLGAFTFHDFHRSTGLANATITNNGHTIKLSIPNSDYSISGGGLAQTYNLQQLHFHWGSSDSAGSEHTVNGNGYPMEAHLVTYASAYGNISTALGHNDGLAVLAVFFEIGASLNAAWDPIISRVSQVPFYQNSTTHGVDLVLSSLLPGNTNSYYRYEGSLTTPGCDEVVTWTIFKETIKISAAQMSTFRSTYSDNGDSLSDNYRPVQSVGARSVYTTSSSSHALSAMSGLLFATSVTYTMMQAVYRKQIISCF